MKKILLNLTVVASLATIFSSCALHSGIATNATVTNLEKANFSYVHRNAEGTSTVTYIIGLGGLKKQALIEEAKRDLLLKVPLKDNQALANMTVSYKSSFILIYEQVQCTVSADIIEFR